MTCMIRQNVVVVPTSQPTCMLDVVLTLVSMEIADLIIGIEQIFAMLAFDISPIHTFIIFIVYIKYFCNVSKTTFLYLSVLTILFHT